MSAASAARAVSAVRGLHRFAAARRRWPAPTGRRRPRHRRRRAGCPGRCPSTSCRGCWPPRARPGHRERAPRAARPGAAGIPVRHRRARVRGGRRAVDDWTSTTAWCCCAARAAGTGSCRSVVTPRTRRGALSGPGRPALLRSGAHSGTLRRCSVNARGGPLTRQGAWGVLRQAAVAGGRRARSSLAAHAAPFVRHPPA